MKKILLLSAVIFGLAACSTSEKKEMKDEAANQAQEQAKEVAKDAKAEAPKAAESTGSKASCTLDKDTRVVEVKKTESGGCELFYTKFGEEKSVASSGFGTQYCEEVKSRIESNLAKAGFTCK